MKTIRNLSIAIPLAFAGTAIADQVILDDLIVDGSTCVGQDCVNGESFGFDTIRLKENNLRIRAVDTSSTSSFPTNDWQITFNDSANGGANKFSIDDIDGGRTPFTIEAGAPSHSLYVDDGGRVGFGTSTPVVDLHVKSGNTPTLRLEQDGSSGFAPQTWDVAGNEAGFFIRDATNGSTLPFRIIPGASSQSLVIDDDDDIGMGAGTNPTASLHVKRSDGTAKLLVEEASGTKADRVLFEVSNNGSAKVQLTNTNAAHGWGFATPDDDSFRISAQGSGAIEFELDGSGNLEIAGNLTELSDRNSKMNIRFVSDEEILNRVLKLPIAKWQYKDSIGTDHIGPMAQDFHAAFGLGKNNTHIATLDMSGVALASIKALYSKLSEKDAEIQALSDELGNLKRLISN